MTSFAVGAATHVGQVRQVNQDNILRAEDVFAVADGMGGHRGGEVASLVAVEALQASFTERTTDALVEAVQSANTAIVDKAKGDPDLRGMGTTICALAAVHLDDGEEVLTVVNVGDSRAYLLKTGDDHLIQISEDHSLVQTLVRQGQLTPAEAAVHPQRNILTRALGIDQRVLPDSFDLLPVKGDRYLLCSDGLFNEVDEARMAEVLRQTSDPQEAAEILVAEANEGGGRDNISVVVVDIVDDAGHHQLLEERSDEHRVVHTVYGPERAGDPAGDPATPGAGPDGDEPATRTTAPPAGRAPVAVDDPPVAAAAAAPIDTGPRRGAGVPVPVDVVAPPVPVAAAKRSRFTWRVGLFVALFLVIFGVAFYAIDWVAKNSYYVAIDQGQVVIFQGRPGGLLWYQPTVVVRTGLTPDQVAPQFLPDVQAGRSESSLADAQAYVSRLPIPTTTTTSTTTTTTTTTVISLPPIDVGGAVAGQVGTAPIGAPTTSP